MDKRMFSRKHIIGTVQQNFFLPEERIVLKGRGVQLNSLPPPWPEVARFIKHYLTCEGRYQVVYQHDFLLLSHLRHNRRVNIPYYLLGCLKNMAHYCRKAKDPTLSLTHHRLVQLLINRGFEQQNRPLNNPPRNPQPAAEIPQEQQQQNPPDVPEVPHIPPTEPTSPVISPTPPNPPHTLPESSTPALHILSDDSEPENVPCPIIQERPPRKRKQIAPFPPFLRKKRTRASMRPPFMITTLDTPPIRLIPRTSSTSQTPGSLPIPTSVAATQEPATDIELQELEAQTSFVFEVAETQPATHPVAETQEPTTGIEIELQEIETPDAATQHPVAETQEPATDFEIEEIETPNAATQHPVAETQEPTTDIDIEIQESEVEGAETLLSLHQEAETQASVAIPVAAPQASAHEAVTATQEPVTSKSKQTMADVLEENNFLKSQLEAYQQELVRAREAYEKELSLYTLARTTNLTEETTESVCKEYMCCQCGDIYHQAGYKVIQVPVPGAAPTPSPFVKEEPAATQEPAGPSKLKTEPAATQEPAGPSKPKTEPAATQEPAGPLKLKTESCIATREAPTVVNKAVQTMPMEEFVPPNQINLSTSREQSTQTLLNPTTSNAETQTQLWDEHTEIQKWKKEYAETQAKNLQVHKQIWINQTFSNWEALDQTRQVVRELKKKNKDLKDRLVLAFDLMQKLLATRKPSCNYSLFLMERLIWFQIKSIIEGKPHEVISSADFIKTFVAASTRDQHLLCEAYFHNEAIPENRLLNINPLVGDVQLRAFTSFLLNQIIWQGDFSAAKSNEDNRLLWIRPEPQRAATFISQYYAFLKQPGVTEHVQQLQSEVIQDCERIIRSIEIPALQANNLFWQQSTEKRQQHNPFGPANLEVAISRIPNYIQCMRHCAENWIGYRFYFPILWLPIERYQISYKLPKKAETTAWQRLQEVQGFRTLTDSTSQSYSLSNLHDQSRYPDSDSE
jgi:hypothetical protein